MLRHYLVDTYQIDVLMVWHPFLRVKVETVLVRNMQHCHAIIALSNVSESQA